MRVSQKLIGAAEERRAILAKVRRELKAARRADVENDPHNAVSSIYHIELWILDRDKRYDKRKGGLGR